MIIPESVRKCVVFIGYQMANGEYIMSGSGFFLGYEETETAYGRSFLVTAKHVIDKIKEKGLDTVWVRFNTKDGQTKWLSAAVDQWVTHPDESFVDIAITPAGIEQDLDHLIVPARLCISDKIINENQVGLGEEVFIVGLFRHHFGKQKNIPIIRIGNLAARNEEKVYTKYGEQDALLIEARSIGGLSGSPVFFNLGSVRVIEGKIKTSPKTEPLCFLCGLIHGHYDESAISKDVQGLTPEQINTGIAIVIPIHKVLEAIEYHMSIETPDFSLQRKIDN